MHININKVAFAGSFEKANDLPAAHHPAIALIGRSNVGKSSLINYLTGHNQLAQISSTPGKTQLINYFCINQAWYLVDLPGYGWAKVSKKNRIQWHTRLKDYLLKHPLLCHVLLLIDSRIPPQSIDFNCLHWLSQQNIDFSIVFTKADSSKKNFRQRLYHRWKELLTQHNIELPEIIWVASKSPKYGKEALLKQINSLLTKHKK